MASTKPPRCTASPVVGGHLTIRDGPASVSAFGLGRADKVLSVRNVAAGQVVLLASCVEGEMRADFPFFGSFAQRGEHLGDDVRLLARVAASGACVAAKDVSMGGFVGLAGDAAGGARCRGHRRPRCDSAPKGRAA